MYCTSTCVRCYFRFFYKTEKVVSCLAPLCSLSQEMSTTTAGSQDSQVSDEMHSQNQTLYPDRQLNYPDRQDSVQSPEESFMQSSFDVPLTQISPTQASQLSNASQTTHISATPFSRSVSATPTPRLIENTMSQQVGKRIDEINTEFKRHGYEAFVHGRLHIIIKEYPFDLTPNW